MPLFTSQSCRLYFAMPVNWARCLRLFKIGCITYDTLRKGESINYCLCHYNSNSIKMPSASFCPERFVMIRIRLKIYEYKKQGGYREGRITSHGLLGTTTLVQSTSLRLAMMTSTKLVWFTHLYGFKIQREVLVRDWLLPVINLFLMGSIIPDMPCLPPPQILCSCFKIIHSTFNCFCALLKEKSFNASADFSFCTNVC